MTQQAEITIRFADRGEFPLLADLEARSDTRFADLPGYEGLVNEGNLTDIDHNDLPQSNHVWLAERGRELLGFALAYPLGEFLFLAQLSVIPEAQENGVGSRLLQAVVDEAGEQDKAGVALTTFADVPWNAPFYEKRGFKVLQRSQMPPDLVAVANDASEAKWAKYGPRVVMAQLF